MAEDIIGKLKRVQERLNTADRNLQRDKGKIEYLKEELAKLGYDSIENAEESLKSLQTDHQKLSRELTELLERAEQLIRRIES